MLKTSPPNPNEFAEAGQMISQWLNAMSEKRDGNHGIPGEDVQTLKGMLAQGLANVRSLYADQVDIAAKFRASYMHFGEALGIDFSKDKEPTDDELLEVFSKREEQTIGRLRKEIEQLKRQLAARGEPVAAQRAADEDAEERAATRKKRTTKKAPAKPKASTKKKIAKKKAKRTARRR